MNVTRCLGHGTAWHGMAMAMALQDPPGEEGQEGDGEASSESSVEQRLPEVRDLLFSSFPAPVYNNRAVLEIDRSSVEQKV